MSILGEEKSKRRAYSLELSRSVLNNRSRTVRLTAISAGRVNWHLGMVDRAAWGRLQSRLVAALGLKKSVREAFSHPVQNGVESHLGDDMQSLLAGEFAEESEVFDPIHLPC